MKPKVGQTAPDFTTEDVTGKPVKLSDYKGKKVYLSFLRNTKCPMCSLHLYKIHKKSDELKSLGIKTLIFYESDKRIFQFSDFFQNEILPNTNLAVISDSARNIYSLYGTDVLQPEAANEAFIKADRQTQIAEVIKLGFTGDGIEPGTNPGAMPADILIDENQIILHSYYGKDGGDQMDLGEIIKLFKEK